MTAAPTTKMQGIEVPVTSVNPALFFELTRRLTVQQKQFSYAGLGLSDTVSMLQAGIISGVTVNATGTLTVTAGTGTVASTARWPYDIAKAVRFAANGQSNLINCGGWDLRARELMARGDLTDRGIVQGIGGTSPGTQVNQGTLSLSAESWGVGSNVSGIASGSYGVDLEWFVPVAFDELHLMGAIFAQTASTDLTLAIDWANVADLFTLTGNATVALSLTVTISATVFDIPVEAGSKNVIIPDLSSFHSLIKTRYNTVSNGDNEIRLSGQGVGRQLLRAYFRTFSGGVPLSLNATNYGSIGWRFGGNDTPELWGSGKQLAYRQEKQFNSDLARYAGYGVLDFCNENAFRDSIDEGTATELRILANIPTAVVLSTPYLDYVQETLSAGAAV
jgi:hypothetical protein